MRSGAYPARGHSKALPVRRGTPVREADGIWTSLPRSEPRGSGRETAEDEQ